MIDIKKIDYQNFISHKIGITKSIIQFNSYVIKYGYEIFIHQESIFIYKENV